LGSGARFRVPWQSGADLAGAMPDSKKPLLAALACDVALDAPFAWLCKWWREYPKRGISLSYPPSPLIGAFCLDNLYALLSNASRAREVVEIGLRWDGRMKGRCSHLRHTTAFS
jgi:hypothetical protein